jgi:selenocysteine lyase/cysteine desulfurase
MNAAVQAARLGLPRANPLFPHIHFNAAGASPSDVSVVETITRHLTLETQIGGYAAAQQVQAQTDAIYESTAALLNAPSPSTIALHDSSTTSFNHGIYSVPLSSSSLILSVRYNLTHSPIHACPTANSHLSLASLSLSSRSLRSRHSPRSPRSPAGLLL